MDHLIVRSLKGRASREELRELSRWRRASRENEDRYQELSAVWELTGIREEYSESDPIPSVPQLLQLRKSPPRRTRRRSQWTKGLAAAAAVGFLALGISHYVPLITVAQDDVVVFQTGENELETAVLEDGSVARLAPNTTLRVTISPDGRQAELEGRAFFAIVHDPNRLFRVHTGAGDVSVLGTRFDLDTTRRGLRVVVVDGRVGLNSPGGATELTKGEIGESRPDMPISVTQVEAPEALLDWLGTWMAFEATPIRDVVRELEIRLGLQIVLADPDVGDRTVTGWFSETDRERMLDLICRVVDLRCETTNGVVRIG